MTNSSTDTYRNDQPHITQHDNKHQDVGNKDLKQMEECLNEMWHVEHLLLDAQFDNHRRQLAIAVLQDFSTHLLTLNEENFTIIF